MRVLALALLLALAAIWFVTTLFERGTATLGGG